MDPNFAEMNSLPMSSSFSRQNVSFSNVPSDDGSRQPQVGRNLLGGNGTGRYPNQGFVSNLMMGNETGPHTDQGFVSNLMVGNGTGQQTGQGFPSSSALLHTFSEAALQQLYHGSQQYVDSSRYMEGNGTTGLNTQQAFALGSVPEHDDSNRQLSYVSHLMVGNGTTGLNTQQAFALGSVPEHDDSNRQLPYVSHLMVMSGTTGLNTEQAFASLEQRSGSGTLQDIFTPTAAPNKPAKTTNGTSNAESSRRSRQKKKEQFQTMTTEIEKMTNEITRLRKINKTCKRDRDDMHRKWNVLRGKVRRLRANLAKSKKVEDKKQNLLEQLIKRLDDMPSQQEENARLRGENARLRGEIARFEAQNELLMQEPYGDPKDEKEWITISLQNRSWEIKNNIIKLSRLSKD